MARTQYRITRRSVDGAPEFWNAERREWVDVPQDATGYEFMTAAMLQLEAMGIGFSEGFPEPFDPEDP